MEKTSASTDRSNVALRQLTAINKYQVHHYN